MRWSQTGSFDSIAFLLPSNGKKNKHNSQGEDEGNWDSRQNGPEHGGTKGGVSVQVVFGERDRQIQVALVFLQKASGELSENIYDINNVELGVYNQASASNTNTSIIRGQWWQAPFQFHRKWLHLLLKSRRQLAVAP